MVEAVRDGQKSACLQQYCTLLEVSEAIASHRELPALFHDLAQRLHEVVSFDYLILVLHDAASNMMRRHILESIESGSLDTSAACTPTALRIEEGPAGRAWETQQPVVISDLAAEKRWPRFQELIKERITSFCYLPLTTARQRLGALAFGCIQVAAYDDADLHYLQLVANQVAVAVENALTFECVEKLNEKLKKENVYLQEEIRTDYNF